MAFDDKNKGNQGGMNKGPNQGGSDRTNPNAPTGGTSKQGQTQGAGKTDNKNAKDFDEDEVSGQKQGQKQTNYSGTGSTGSASGNRGPTGSSGGQNH